MSCSRLLILKVLFRDLQNNLNNNNIKDRQKKLSRIQLLKTHYIIKNHRQDSRDNNDNLTLQHDRKVWHASIIINESISE